MSRVPFILFFPAARREIDPSDIVPALRIWRSWEPDWAPVGATGNADVDRQLADAFRALAGLPDTGARLTWIEERVRRFNEPAPNEQVDPVRGMLIAWWLAIYDDYVGNPRVTRSFRPAAAGATA